MSVTSTVLACAMMATGSSVAAQDEILLSAGKRCVFSPQPDYSLNADVDDPIQLTDGVRHTGQIWTNRNTVGWAHVPLPTLTIDLGTVHAIGKVNYHAAGGCCGAYFPEATALLLSDDGQHFEIAALNSWPPGEQKGAHVRKFQIDAKHKRARYVRLTFEPHRGFVMLDEVEVLADRLSEQRLSEYQKSSTRASWQLWEWVGVRPQLTSLAGDRENARKAIASLDRRFSSVDLSGGPVADELLREALAMRGDLAHGRYGRDWMVWDTPPWADLRGSTFAAADQKPATSIELRLWRHEYESAALSIGNFTTESRAFTIQVGALSDATGRPYEWAGRLWLRHAMFVHTFSGPRVADPLPLLSRSPAGPARLQVSAGGVKILWLTLRAAGLPAGEYTAALDIGPENDPSQRRRVRLDLRVDPLTMPGPTEVALTSEHYVQRWGWNLPAEVETDLERHYSNARVFHPVCLPWPKLNATRTVLESVDFAAYDKALDEVGPIRVHSVFWGGGPKGAPVIRLFDLETEAGQACFKQWIQAWVDHLAGRGLDFEHHFFYPYDEQINEPFILIARLIKEVDHRLRIVCNAVRDKFGATPDAIARIAPHIDIWCPATRNFYGAPDASGPWPEPNRRAVEAARRKKPGILWIYNLGARGDDFPLGYKHLPPERYTRWMPWLLFRHGATMAGLWCYGSTYNAWDDFCGTRPDYALIYLSRNAPAGVPRHEVVIPSRRWESWREGVEDYQYLHELKQAIDAARNTGADERSAQEAERVLEQQLRDLLDWPPRSEKYNRARNALTEAILKLRRIVNADGLE